MLTKFSHNDIFISLEPLPQNGITRSKDKIALKYFNKKHIHSSINVPISPTKSTETLNILKKYMFVASMFCVIL